MRPEHWLYTIPLRLHSLFRSRRVEQDLDDEMQYHLEMEIRENILRGMNREEARHAALRKFGGVEQVKEHFRDRRRVNLLDNLMRDTRLGFRSLRKAPGFTVAAIITLALGIGSTTTIFTITYSVLFPALPYANAQRLFDVLPSPSLSEFVDWRERNEVFDELAAWRMADNVWSDQEEPERISGLAVTANLFRMAGVSPFLGSDFPRDAEKPGKGNLVILGYGLWQQRYSGDRNVIGKSVTLNGKPFLVIGVMPVDKGYPSAKTRYWLPWGIDEDPGRLAPFNIGFRVVGRLKRGITLDRARIAMNLLARQSPQRTRTSEAEPSVGLEPVLKGQIGGNQLTVLTLLGSVLFVLLIACVNVASLILARGSARGKETAMRAALGATRARLIQYMLAESLLLSFFGGGLGVLLGYWGLRAFVVLKAPGIPGPSQIHFDSVILAFALGSSILTAFVFGLLPAIHASSPSLVDALKQTGRTSQRFGNRLRGALIVTEIALSLTLLAGAGLMMRSFLLLRGVELGFDPNNLITVPVTLPKTADGDTSPQQSVAFLDDSLHRLRLLPGVRETAAVNMFPLEGSTAHGVITLGDDARAKKRPVEFIYATDTYFHTMAIPLLEGRGFGGADRSGAPATAIVSERLGHLLWPNETALGKKIRFGSDPNPRKIVGIVGDARYGVLQDEYRPKIYFPYSQHTSGFSEITIVVRTMGPPRSLVPLLRREIRALDPKVTIGTMDTAEELYRQWIVEPRFYLGLFGFFAILAVALACVGVYGVISYSVGQRTQEIGIRMAVGAQAGDVVLMVMKQGAILVLLGASLGLAGALALTRFIKSFLFGVTPTDAGTLGLVSALLIAAAMFACLMPARRAMKVDPMVALRYE